MAENKQQGVKTRKTDAEFIGDLTTTAQEAAPDENGIMIIEGSFPQVQRKPITDKTSNGMIRTTF